MYTVGMTSENVCQPTGKKEFATESEANKFEAEQRLEYPHEATQHPYRCEHGDHYHLTTQTRESYGLAKPRQIIPSKMGNSREDVADRRRMVAQHRAQGKTARQIAVALGMSKETVHSDFNVLNGAKAKPAVTRASLEAQKIALEAQIETLRQQEAAALLAKQFRFDPRTDGRILIRKDGQQMHLCPDDAFELVDKLTEYLTALPASAS
jgi:hypothetical protein